MYKLLSWLAAVIWMAVIFYLSHQPATTSSELSSGLTQFMMNTIEIIVPNQDLNGEAFHLYVRKGAHFFAYFMLGILVLHALRCSKLLGFQCVGFALLICVLYAVSDEVHQLFITGRSGEIRDVLIDSAGSSVGIGVWLVMKRIVKWKKRK